MEAMEVAGTVGEASEEVFTEVEVEEENQDQSGWTDEAVVEVGETGVVVVAGTEAGTMNTMNTMGTGIGETRGETEEMRGTGEAGADGGRGRVGAGTTGGTGGTTTARTTGRGTGTGTWRGTGRGTGPGTTTGGTRRGTGRGPVWALRTGAMMRSEWSPTTPAKIPPAFT